MDLLVKLYELPEAGEALHRLRTAGIVIRRAMVYEKFQVVAWVEENFGRGWGAECDVAFSRNPVAVFVAVREGEMVGFACHDTTMKNFFGPLGVGLEWRKKGVGAALLLGCLRMMAADGYAYAIIGGVDNVDFYAKTAGAVAIPGSSPGVYGDRLRG
ncbi:MAG: GNAT family N-acetyltransferase [Deltaproteobacteria bacterium]|nr:GNAT family N-acetyltransferase [Deltaproteobacteria bacterium]